MMIQSPAEKVGGVEEGVKGEMRKGERGGRGGGKRVGGEGRRERGGEEEEGRRGGEGGEKGVAAHCNLHSAVQCTEQVTSSAHHRDHSC